MSEPHTDDLFEESNMTFGEHLDELRTVLIRAVMWIIGGFLLGLFIADDVVKIIETPLRNALSEYYLSEDVDQIAEEMREKGESLTELERMAIKRRNLTFEWVRIERAELERLQRQFAAPGEITPSTAIPEGASLVPSDDMLPLRVWKSMRTRISALSAQEAFMIWVKAAFVAGIILVSPMVFNQIWWFIAAGLYPHERKYVYIYLPFSVGLFLSGAALAFFFVFQPVLDFLFSFNRWMGIDPDPRISEWITFVLILPLGFGVSFQLPLVMLLLNRLGIFSLQIYLGQWRLAVLAIFVISMFLTPADPISMLLMAVPLSVLYFLGVALCIWTPGASRNPFPEGRDPR